MAGWIKLHRSISDHWVWDCEFSYGQAWIDLLCHACHKKNKLTIKGQLITLDIGQQARSEVTLAKTWKWSRNKVRRFLKNLEKDGMIEQKTTHLTSIISVCNYESFQHSETSNGTPKGQVTEHKQEGKKEKNKDNVLSGDKLLISFVRESEQEIIEEWNSLQLQQHRKIVDKAMKNIVATYKCYKKEWCNGEPVRIDRWVIGYVRSGIPKLITEYHRADGVKYSTLELFTRKDKYESLKNMVEQ